jgi:hypothetical protein
VKAHSTIHDNSSNFILSHFFVPLCLCVRLA